LIYLLSNFVKPLHTYPVESAIPSGKRRGRQPCVPTPEIAKVQRRLRRIFASLEGLPYLGEAEREDYRFYEALFEESLARIETKVREGRLRPMDLRGFPQDLRYPGYVARAGIFIGSFDPFQMTHLAMALRFLASDACEADLVFVVPDGSADARKPGRTEYDFRYEIARRQLAGVLDPLVLPLDIGRDADTITIVTRLIALHRGAKLHLTHLLGSDSLPLALSLLPDDLEAWVEAALEHRVALDFSIFTLSRDKRQRIRPVVDAVRRLGVRTVVDRSPIGTPSSSHFRSGRVITLVLPTEALLSRLELLFRYGMNRPWSPRIEEPGCAPCGRPAGSCGSPCAAAGAAAASSIWPEYEI
jgi:hypothetical protein